MEHFGERMAAATTERGNCAVLGLDPHLDRFPAAMRSQFEALSGEAYRVAAARVVRDFNRAVIEAIEGVVPAVKPQFAFYERLGSAGFAALEDTCETARAAGLLVIGDAKRGDIASTATAYAETTLHPDGPFACDAVTVNPWMGADTLEPFVSVCAAHGRGLFVLVRTTNPGSGFLQAHGDPSGAAKVADALHAAGRALCGPRGMSSIGAVVGVMSADEASGLRSRMENAWFLVPGVGAQGGDPSDAMAGARPDGLGCLVNSSRAVLYPTDPDPAYEADPFPWIRAQAEAHAARFRMP